MDLSREAGVAALLVRNDGKRFVLGSRIEMPRLLSEELDGEEFEPVEFSWKKKRLRPNYVATRAVALLGNGALGSDLGVGLDCTVS